MTRTLLFVGALLFFAHLIWRFAVYHGKLMR